VDDEEQCTCTFKVLWQAGPVANQRTSVSCANICLLTAGSIETHPVINDLLRLVEEKLDSRTRSVGRNPLRSKRTDKKGWLCKIAGVYTCIFCFFIKIEGKVLKKI
jgi:hypothetical protein